MMIDDLVPELLLRAPDVPDVLAQRALLRATRELCRRALVWRDEVTIDLASATDNRYALLPPAGEVVDITRAELQDKHELLPAVPSQLVHEDAQWRSRTGEPRYYMRWGQDTVSFYPQATSGAVVMELALTPTVADTQLDDNFAQEWDEVIMDGALHRLLSMPNQPWADGNAAVFHFQRFEQAIDEARSRARDHRQRGTVRVVRYGGL